jgi:hypothetical protein
MNVTDQSEPGRKVPDDTSTQAPPQRPADARYRRPAPPAAHRFAPARCAARRSAHPAAPAGTRVAKVRTSAGAITRTAHPRRTTATAPDHEASPGQHDVVSADLAQVTPASGDRARAWLAGAMAALAVLAAAAAAVSWDAQYTLIQAIKGIAAIAALEAAIPDMGALIFAALGIALALHGRRAIRPRGLNLACVGISLAMNALAAAPGWRDLAVWVMPAAVYALASDTLIGVVRAWAIAGTRTAGPALADDGDATPMAIIGGLILWLLRLALAPFSTLTGFRRWVLEECPVAPGRTAARDRAALSPSDPAARPPDRIAGGAAGTRRPGKQARMLALAGQRHDLATLPLKQVSRIANQIGAEVSLSPGTARRVLLAHVRALQNGHPKESA